MNVKVSSIQKRPEQLGLWESYCALNCLAWDICGGSTSAPCNCAWPKPEEKPDCNNCPIICVDRKVNKKSDHSRDDFRKNLLSGSPLRDLTVSHPYNHPQIPLLIPTRTQELSAGRKVSLSWAAIDAKLLFSEHKNIPVTTRSYINSEENMRSFYRVDTTTNMIAVLNGKDEILEGFWGANRSAIYSKFKKTGFYAVTGPTFSVTDESEGGLASHNICMMLRHNRVIQELQKTELVAIPNIYWRNEKDLRKWSDWISAQNELRYISRDFSRTKPNKTFKPQFEGLLKILKHAGKSVHVLLVGVGVKKAEYVMRMLNEIDCTCTFVMGYPIMTAILGGCRIKIKKGEPLNVFKDIGIKRQDLALDNLKIMEDYLVSLALDMDCYDISDKSFVLGV